MDGMLEAAVNKHGKSTNDLVKREIARVLTMVSVGVTVIIIAVTFIVTSGTGSESLLNDPISTFLLHVKTINTVGFAVVQLGS
jgi:hypothetical protein